ncbi:methyl-accepting chemotaxis protein, partial [Halobellus sp. Atlit-31R]
TGAREIGNLAADPHQWKTPFEQARDLLAQMTAHAGAYTAGQDALMKHILEGRDDDARRYLSESLRPVLGKLKKSVQEQTALQTAMSNDKAAEARQTYENTVRLMSALGAVAVAIAAFIGWWITRSITRPVQRALEVANTVAAGDLTSRIDVGTRDEAGQLLQAL